jgi:hypothetical protein
MDFGEIRLLWTLKAKEEQKEEEFMEFKSFSSPRSEIHIIKSQD